MQVQEEVKKDQPADHQDDQQQEDDIPKIPVQRIVTDLFRTIAFEESDVSGLKEPERLMILSNFFYFRLNVWDKNSPDREISMPGSYSKKSMLATQGAFQPRSSTVSSERTTWEMPLRMMPRTLSPSSTQTRTDRWTSMSSNACSFLQLTRVWGWWPRTPGTTLTQGPRFQFQCRRWLSAFWKGKGTWTSGGRRAGWNCSSTLITRRPRLSTKLVVVKWRSRCRTSLPSSSRMASTLGLKMSRQS